MKNAALFILTLSSLLVYGPCVLAQGNLIIIPRRVVFEGSKRTQELNLANTGIDTAKYLISVVQYKMKDNGNLEKITQPDSGQYFADKNFRFFPRSVILGPNEAQTVKIQLTNTGDLEAGEYRSHLYFRAIPNEAPLAEKPVEKDSKNISIHLVPIFGIAIPVIIRKGIPTTEVTIYDPALVITPNVLPQLKLFFKRTGNMSVYGDIKATHISPKGKITQVGMAKGFAIYTPNKLLTFTLKLHNDLNVDYHKGKLHIIYTTPSDAKYVKIAETELALF